MQPANSFPPRTTSAPTDAAEATLGGLGQDQLAALALGVLASVSVLVAFLTKSTYDTGDSISHYLYARYVPQHPMHLLHAWAKPVFTLLAAGPAQFGFMGMKLFQCLLVAVSAWLAYRTARRLGLPWPALAVVFCYAAPDYFRIQFSGLTEPLFGFILIAAVHSAVADKPVRSAFLMSWLPLVRSEGILLWGLWGVYLLWNGNWRALPWLGLGYLVYSVVGWWALHNFFWLFTNNPYAFHSPYGSGSWLTFIKHFPSLLGWPLSILLLIGGTYTLWRATTWAEWRARLFRAEVLLIFGTITLFTFTHSALWALGLFGSFGMTRVMTVLVPLCAIGALRGLDWLAQRSPVPARQRLVRTLGAGLVAAMVLLPRIGNNSSNLRWHRDFREPSDLQLADQGIAWLQQHDPQWRKQRIGFEHYYYPMRLDADPFDSVRVRTPLTRDWAPYLEEVPLGSYIFWDDWFSPVEGRLPLEKLQQDGRFKELWHSALDEDPQYPSGHVRSAYIFQRVK